MMHVKDSYTMFCKSCGWARPIPDVMMMSVFIHASHVECTNCKRKIKIPQSLQYIAIDMSGGEA